MIAFPLAKTVIRPADDLLLVENLSAMQGRSIRVTDVFRVFRTAGVRAVLVGAHAVNARSGEARPTQDIDVVAPRPKQVVEVLRRAYPHLEVDDHPVVTRFKDAGRETIDVIKPRSSKLFKRILQLTESLDVEGVAVELASVEAVLALKFQAMVSPARLMEKKYRDAADFIAIAKLLKRVDEKLLGELGDLVYAGGGKELLKLVADARAGRRLEF